MKEKSSLLFFEWKPGNGIPSSSQTWPFDATDDEDAREQVAKFVAADNRRIPERLFREISLQVIGGEVTDSYQVDFKITRGEFSCVGTKSFEAKTDNEAISIAQLILKETDAKFRSVDAIQQFLIENFRLSKIETVETVAEIEIPST